MVAKTNTDQASMLELQIDQPLLNANKHLSKASSLLLALEAADFDSHMLSSGNIIDTAVWNEVMSVVRGYVSDAHTELEPFVMNAIQRKEQLEAMEEQS